MPELTDKRVERDKAKEIVDAVNLKAIRLLESVVKQRLRKGKLPGELKVMQEISANVDKAQSRLSVIAHFVLIAHYEDDAPDNIDAENVPLFIGADFELVYDITAESPLDDDHLNAFATHTGLFNVWPYWREFVSATSVRMALPPITIPLLKFPFHTELNE